MTPAPLAMPTPSMTIETITRLPAMAVATGISASTMPTMAPVKVARIASMKPSSTALPP